MNSRQRFPLNDTQQKSRISNFPRNGINTTTEWVLQSKSKKQSYYSRSNRRLVYVTSEYDRFDGFEAAMQKSTRKPLLNCKSSLWL